MNVIFAVRVSLIMSVMFAVWSAWSSWWLCHPKTPSPRWTDIYPADIISQCQDEWKSVLTVNSWLVDDPATRIQSILTPLGTSKLLSDQPRPLCILSKEVGALQQPTCILVANAKRCHILSTAAHSDQAGGWSAVIALSWWRCHWMAEDIWLVNALEKNINCLCCPPW